MDRSRLADCVVGNCIDSTRIDHQTIPLAVGLVQPSYWPDNQCVLVFELVPIVIVDVLSSQRLNIDTDHFENVSSASSLRERHL